MDKLYVAAQMRRRFPVKKYSIINQNPASYLAQAVKRQVRKRKRWHDKRQMRLF